MGWCAGRPSTSPSTRSPLRKWAPRSVEQSKHQHRIYCVSTAATTVGTSSKEAYQATAAPQPWPLSPNAAHAAVCTTPARCFMWLQAGQWTTPPTSSIQSPTGSATFLFSFPPLLGVSSSSTGINISQKKNRHHHLRPVNVENTYILDKN